MPFQDSAHQKGHDMALISFIIRNTIDLNSSEEFGYLKLHYLGQYYQFHLFIWISALKWSQIELFEDRGHRKRLYIALITFIIWCTMDWNRSKDLGHFRYIICVNIVYFACFPWISTLNSAQIRPLGHQGHKKWLTTALVWFINGIAMDWSRLDEFLSIQQSL